ncbi:hypothetical protein MKX07_004312 [Trichoderma sp. CBMAI-0711]|nr:hypothetical protein MKX07_004312 [Trichoderma sp. CBMAI-0711]
MRLPAKVSALLPLLKVTDLEPPCAEGGVESADVGAAPKTNNQPQFILQLDELRDRLFADGELVATNEGTTHQPLLETPSTAAIDNGFSLEEGILQWRHPSFTGGKASFCLSESNTVLAVFNETSIPTDCAPANLVNVPYDDDSESSQRAAGSSRETGSRAGANWLDAKPDVAEHGYGRASAGPGQPSPPPPVDRTSYNYNYNYNNDGGRGSTTPPSSVGYGGEYNYNKGGQGSTTPPSSVGSGANYNDNNGGREHTTPPSSDGYGGNYNYKDGGWVLQGPQIGQSLLELMDGTVEMGKMVMMGETVMTAMTAIRGLMESMAKTAMTGKMVTMGGMAETAGMVFRVLLGHLLGQWVLKVLPVPMVPLVLPVPRVPLGQQELMVLLGLLELMVLLVLKVRQGPRALLDLRGWLDLKALLAQLVPPALQAPRGLQELLVLLVLKVKLGLKALSAPKVLLATGRRAFRASMGSHDLDRRLRRHLLWYGLGPITVLYPRNRRGHRRLHLHLW